MTDGALDIRTLDLKTLVAIRKHLKAKFERITSNEVMLEIGVEKNVSPIMVGYAKEIMVAVGDSIVTVLDDFIAQVIEAT